METQTQMAAPIQKSGGAKDFIINFGAFVSLYVLVGSLLSLLFTVINTAYPQITNGYSYYGGSQSISWPVATLIIFFPIFILLMWLLEREYKVHPEKQSAGVHRWLTYITLFAAGATVAGDLIAILYYFIDGQELTTSFLLKVLVVLIIAAAIFTYYISDVSGKLTSQSRKIWRVVAAVIVVGSIVWGFAVLGSPRTQQLLKYDIQKVSDLQNINSQIQNYFYNKSALPKSISDLSSGSYSSSLPVDPQTHESYIYEKTSETTYNVCADFNKKSPDDTATRAYISYSYGGDTNWTHPEGDYCFKQTVKPDQNKYPAYPDRLPSPTLPY